MYKKGTWVQLKNGDLALVTGFEDHQYKIVHYRYVDWLNIYDIRSEYVDGRNILGRADVPRFQTGDFALYKNKVVKITETGYRHTIECDDSSLCVEPFKVDNMFVGIINQPKSFRLTNKKFIFEYGH